MNCAYAVLTDITERLGRFESDSGLQADVKAFVTTRPPAIARVGEGSCRVSSAYKMSPLDPDKKKRKYVTLMDGCPVNCTLRSEKESPSPLTNEGRKCTSKRSQKIPCSFRSYCTSSALKGSKHSPTYVPSSIVEYFKTGTNWDVRKSPKLYSVPLGD